MRKVLRSYEVKVLRFCPGTVCVPSRLGGGYSGIRAHGFQNCLTNDACFILICKFGLRFRISVHFC